MLIKGARPSPSGAQSCQTKGPVPLLWTVGQYHSRLSRLPRVLVIRSYRRRPSLGVINASDINLSDILLDGQWNNKERWAHSWTFYWEQAGETQQGGWERGPMSEYWAGAAGTQKTAWRCRPISTCAKRVEENFFFLFLQARDGFCQYQLRVELQGFQTRAGGFGLFLCIT